MRKHSYLGAKVVPKLHFRDRYGYQRSVAWCQASKMVEVLSHTPDLLHVVGDNNWSCWLECCNHNMSKYYPLKCYCRVLYWFGIAPAKKEFSTRLVQLKKKGFHTRTRLV